MSQFLEIKIFNFLDNENQTRDIIEFLNNPEKDFLTKKLCFDCEVEISDYKRTIWNTCLLDCKQNKFIFSVVYKKEHDEKLYQLNSYLNVVGFLSQTNEVQKFIDDKNCILSLSDLLDNTAFKNLVNEFLETKCPIKSISRILTLNCDLNLNKAQEGRSFMINTRALNVSIDLWKDRLDQLDVFLKEDHQIDISTIPELLVRVIN